MTSARKTMNRREFLRTAGVGLIGASVAWQFGGTLAWGQLPPDASSTLLGEDNLFDLSPMWRVTNGIKNEAPRLAFDARGNPSIAWIAEDGEGEHVMLTRFSRGEFDEPERLSGEPYRAIHPEIVRLDDDLVTVWSEHLGGRRWRLAARFWPDGRLLGLDDEEGLAWQPAIAAVESALWVVYECLRPGRRPMIVARRLERSGWGPAISISDAPQDDCRRPAIAADGQGQVWVAWDQTEGAGGPRVLLTRFDGQEIDNVRDISRHPAGNIAPALAVDAADRVWVGWHSNRRGEREWDIPRWFQLRCLVDGILHEPDAGDPPGKDLEAHGTVQGFEFCRLLAASDGRIIITGRPSHNFCLQHYHGNRWSPLWRLPEDGWGGRGQYLEAALDSGGDLWVARRDLGFNVLQRIEGMNLEKAEPALRPLRENRMARFPVPVNILKKPEWEPLEELEGIEESLQFFYGDTHGHTWMSDGMGDVDEYYHLRRDYYADDFASLTDHDTFVGNGLLPSEFELIKEITQQFHEDGRFVTLFGQEYTSARYPRQIGHKNLYCVSQEVPLFDHTDDPTDTSAKLNAKAREHRCLIIPHHTGWTGTDWEGADREVQRLAEIVSNHGCFEYMGNEPIKHRGGARGCFIQDGLAMGLRFGLIGGSDSHGLLWHHRAGWKRDCNRTGLACVLAPRLTREAIFDALWRRRTFASTGTKPRMDFRVNGHLMGEEIETSETGVSIRVDVTAPEVLDYLTIVKNNEDWYDYGGEGFRSRFTVSDDELEPGVSWYYLRVTFKTGDMAWSSPVWVTRKV